MNINNLPILMIKCLLLTIIIELLVSFIIGIRNKKNYINIILVNVITNPLVVIIPIAVSYFINYKYQLISLYILEIFTVIIEGLIYKKYLINIKINPFIISFILNLSSYFIGKLF